MRGTHILLNGITRKRVTSDRLSRIPRATLTNGLSRTSAVSASVPGEPIRILPHSAGVSRAMERDSRAWGANKTLDQTGGRMINDWKRPPGRVGDRRGTP